MAKNKMPFNHFGWYLLISTGFSLSMLAFRILFTGSMHFAFLVWNLFLAFIPLAISSMIIKKSYLNWLQYLLSGLLWLLFLPNAPYIITDFIHLDGNAPVPHWFDLMLILSFAWNGIFYWLITMFHFNRIINKSLHPTLKTAINHMIILLTSIGVYLGRYGRFNSWDVFFEPIGILRSVTYMIFHPFHFPAFYGMTITVYFFLVLVFSFFLKVGQTGIPQLIIQIQRHDI
jgi:uncharacterized membrane protein